MATNTVPTFTNHTGNGTAGPFNIGFNYIDKSEVIVRVNEVLKSTPTHYTFTSNTQITFTSGNEPASGLNIEFRRSTNITTAKVDFEDGSVLTEADLDANTNQLLFALQENTDAVNADNLESSSIYLRDGSRTLTGNIVFEGSTKDAHETTLTPIDPTADRTITLPNASGALMVSGSIVNADINASAEIAGSKINPNFGSKNIIGNGSQITNPNPNFGSQNIVTTGNCTATNFIGNGSQLTNVTAQFGNANTLDNLDSLQFVRSDVDDDYLGGHIRFASSMTFNCEKETIDGVTQIDDDEFTTQNTILFKGAHSNQTMEWVSHSSSGGLRLGDGTPLQLGSNTYFKIFHNGTNHDAIIENAEGLMKLSSTEEGFKFVGIRNHDLENLVEMKSIGTHPNQTSEINLYAHNSIQCKVTSTGLNVTGNVTATTFVGNVDAVDGDFDGTLEADTITVAGVPLSTVIAGTTVTTATNANHIFVVDNESTNENNLIPFIENASATGNVGLESDGDFTYNPSTGTVTATLFAGTLSTAAQTNVTSLGTLTGLTLSGDMTFTGSSANIVFDKSDNSLEFADNAKVTFGSSADLTISHNGSNSIINDSGTGELLFQRAGNTILSLDADGISITDPNSSASVTITGHEGANALVNLVADQGDDNGDSWKVISVASDNDLRFQNDISGSFVQKWRITTDGDVTQTGHLDLPDNKNIRLGDSGDLSLYHDGSDSYIVSDTNSLFIKADSNKDGIQINNNGKVALFYQGVEKFKTTGNGSETIGISTASGVGTVGFKVPDNPDISNESTTHGMFIIGTGDDLIIRHNGTDSVIENDTGNLLINAKNGEQGIKVIPDGALELYFDGVKKFETTSSGAKIEKGGTAQFHLINTNTSGANHVFLGLRSYSDDADTKILFGTSADDNPGEIKYISDNNKFQIRVNSTNTLQLTNTELNPNTDNAVALGTSSKRFTTLHSAALNTGDIHMNNLDHTSGNEVDGTKGSWSLQEGADNLFLINRVSGKKYKFNLTEIN